LTKVRPDLPPELGAVIHKMMAKDPAQRYQTCRDLLKDVAHVRDTLNGVTSHLPLSATGLIAEPIGSRTALMVAPRRRRLLVAFVVSLLAAGAVGAGLGLW